MAKRINWEMEGQLSIFSFMEQFPTDAQKKDAENVLAAPVASFSEKKAAIMESAEEYLKKGERLTTLARERFGEMLKLFTFSELEEKLYSINVSSYRVSSMIPKIATTVVRPLLKKITSFDDNDEALKMLKQLAGYDINIREVDSSEHYVFAVRALRVHSEKILCLTLKEEGFKPLVVYGLWLNAHPRNRKNTHFKDSSVTGDIAEIIAWLICFNEFTKAIKNKDLTPAIELQLDGIIRDPMSVITEIIQKETYYGNWCTKYKDIRECYYEHRAPLCVPLQRYRRPSKDAIRNICSILGAEEDRVQIADSARDTFIARNRLEISERDNPYMYGISRDLDLAFLAIDPFNWLRTTKKVYYHDFLLRKTNNESLRAQNDADHLPDVWPEPVMKYIYGGTKGYVIQAMEKVLELVFLNYKEKINTLNYFRECAKDRAKVYQTKKNIPAKTVNQMQKSVFNEYFGYVEFDEDVDLEKVEEIAAEFTAFKETYLKNVDSKNVSIRFRRLGNYKAAGLYFPELGCLCVDFRHPDSLVHEYGHCIDNTMGKRRNLSEEPDFYRVKTAYREAFSMEVFRQGKKLTGKYNASYYLQATEIFARCFEMYVCRSLGVENSICSMDKETAFAYPEDKNLMQRINDYFGKLLDGFGSTEIAA